MPKDVLVNINQLKADSYLDANVDNNSIRVAVLYMQDEIIEHLIGTDLFDVLLALVRANKMDSPGYHLYKVLNDEYLFPIFVWGVQAELSIPKTYKLRNAGLVQQTGDNIQQSALPDIKYTNSYYKNKVDFYIERAKKFLKCNKCSFPELCGCGCSWCKDDMLDKMPTNSPLNLKKVNVKKRIR